eukprot:102562-Prymnesium_polylepis.1
MSRKLILTGWVLLIREDFEQARVVLALLVSVAFLAVRLTVRPVRRADNSVVTAILDLALII